MNFNIIKATNIDYNNSFILIADKKTNFKTFKFNSSQLTYIKNKIADDVSQITIQNVNRFCFIHIVNLKKDNYIQSEKIRISGNTFGTTIKKEKIKEIIIVDAHNKSSNLLAMTEGLILGLYQFTKYLKEKKKKEIALKTIEVYGDKISNKDLEEIKILSMAVFKTRDLVNEPVSFLTAPQLAKEIVNLGKNSGFKVDVFDKKKIESLRMGGLLAVNKGSIDPPRFSVLTWKPENAKNKKPIVFVGKGIVYDTGGLSLKPTPDSMEWMKSDMAGAAAVAGLFYAISKLKLPVYAVGLIPSTDNRPDGNAYTPGDIIRMYNGLHVEVLNTDAEGRMILADALSYASRFKPELVFDLATLTGAAHAAIGHYATVAMGTAKNTTFNKLKESGNEMYERIVEFPFWEEYDELIKSDIADLKNIGGRIAGAITAGKFLEHFTDYEWIHLDIAGPAFVTKDIDYMKKGGTGVGVRLLYHFLKTNY
ncbi:MAG: leucyl aminopeptidase [Chlorobi bacterium]|nr:leucyl aminopeptidase [Chlorobiota bacterium]